jgi:hypothetical protein
MSKLNQAVLIELAGLISLFVVSRPYNLVGWLVIVAGGLLYRQELKRIKAQKESETAAKSGD